MVVNFTKRTMGTIGDGPTFYPSQIKHLFIPPYIHSTSTFTVFHGVDNPGPESRLECSELLCNKVLLKYEGARESF